MPIAEMSYSNLFIMKYDLFLPLYDYDSSQLLFNMIMSEIGQSPHANVQCCCSQTLIIMEATFVHLCHSDSFYLIVMELLYDNVNSSHVVITFSLLS